MATSFARQLQCHRVAGQASFVENALIFFLKPAVSFVLAIT
jgi:hypothetical protein